MDDEYELKLIVRAFKSALFMYGEDELLQNPGLLLLEMECIRNLDKFLSFKNKKFKKYEPKEIKNALI